MIKFKKTLFTTLLIVTILILAGLGYFVFIKYNNSYEKISHETKEKITAIINKSKGEKPNLQSDSSLVGWLTQAHNKQKEMMDKVLDTLTVKGEAKKEKPQKYIIATYSNGNMHLYIAYKEKTFYKKIIIEIYGHYYVATANKEDVNAIVDYMKNTGFLY